MSARQSTPAVGIVVQCELSVEVPAIAEPAPGTTALVLVRLFSEPIGMLSLTPVRTGPDSPRSSRLEIVGELGSELRERFSDCGDPVDRVAAHQRARARPHTKLHRGT